MKENYFTHAVYCLWSGKRKKKHKNKKCSHDDMEASCELNEIESDHVCEKMLSLMCVFFGLNVTYSAFVIYTKAQWTFLFS